ncbi:hypothetical protein AL035_02315 [Salipiger aestuarii]|nr:hypothetical protein AL037_02310 [Salipiger aestuarii]KAB2543316.1 hypothetical protein AL035_02315 [Salipiger aestuarii]
MDNSEDRLGSLIDIGVSFCPVNPRKTHRVPHKGKSPRRGVRGHQVSGGPGRGVLSPPVQAVSGQLGPIMKHMTWRA